MAQGSQYLPRKMGVWHLSHVISPVMPFEISKRPSRMNWVMSFTGTPVSVESSAMVQPWLSLM
jgi:hypothetical protein